MGASGTLDRDGFALEWAREGQGIPMLVVGSQRYYRRAFPAALREHFDVAFVDSRQWAPTPPGFDLDTINVSTFPDDVEAARVATGLDRPIVVGHSQHGALAFEYARRYPDAVRGLALVAAMPPFSAWADVEPLDDYFRRDASAERQAAHERYQAARGDAPVQTAADFVDDYIGLTAKYWYDVTFDARPLWDGVEMNLEVLYRLFAPDVLGTYEIVPLDIPVFLALGRYDYGIPPYVWEAPKKKLPRLTYRLYDRSAHSPQIEQPDEFARDLVAWAAELA